MNPNTLAHLSAPVEPDDVFALEHGLPLRVVAVVELHPGGVVAYALEAAGA